MTPTETNKRNNKQLRQTQATPYKTIQNDTQQSNKLKQKPTKTNDANRKQINETTTN